MRAETGAFKGRKCELDLKIVTLLVHKETCGCGQSMTTVPCSIPTGLGRLVALLERALGH